MWTSLGLILITGPDATHEHYNTNRRWAQLTILLVQYFQLERVLIAEIQVIIPLVEIGCNCKRRSGDVCNRMEEESINNQADSIDSKLACKIGT